MMSKRRPLRLRGLSAVSILALLALTIVGAGCSSRLPTAPDPGVDPTPTPAPRVARPPASPALLGRLFGGLSGGGSGGGLFDSPMTRPRWYEVANQWVEAGVATTVQGSRYTLKFATGSLSEGAQVRILEYHPDVLDFQLEPHGTTFGTPVQLVIDYKNTNVDPLSPQWDGSLPLFLWLNPSTNLWEVVPGVNNVLTRTYYVQLPHFSRYQLTTERQGGTAEW